MTFKEYSLQDGNTLEATQSMLESRAVTQFPLGDQEILLRLLHTTARDYVADYQREQLRPSRSDPVLSRADSDPSRRGALDDVHPARRIRRPRAVLRLVPRVRARALRQAAREHDAGAPGVLRRRLPAARSRSWSTSTSTSSTRCPTDATHLLWLCYSLVNVSFPAEVWRQPQVPDSGAARIDASRRTRRLTRRAHGRVGAAPSGTGDAPGDARRRVRRPRDRRSRPGRRRVPGLPHVDGVGRVDARQGALTTARPQPARDGDDRRARPDGGVRAPREQHRAAPASPTRSSTSCCSRSPRTAARPAGVAARRGIQAARAARGSRLTVETVGFVGLGNMGSVLAANLVAAGHDRRRPRRRSGRQRAPGARRTCRSVADVARRAPVVVLSLPDGAASEQVAREIARGGRSLAPRTWSTPRPSACAPRRPSARCSPTAELPTSTRPCRAGSAGRVPARSR